jgi:hypothetical protein
MISPANVLDQMPANGGRSKSAMLGAEQLAPADPRDLAKAVAFALRYQGRRRVQQADEYMVRIAAERIVEHLARVGFVVMKRTVRVSRSGA